MRWLAFAMAGIMLATLPVADLAMAQESRSFLERLFTPLHRRPPPPPRQIEPAAKKPPQPQKRKAVRRAPASQNKPAAAGAASRPAAAPRPAETAKLENARIVLVIGDFTAGGLAEGLTEAFADAPGVKIVQKANGSSGLVRDDYYDWFAALPEMIDEIKPSIVAVMIGANDRQEMRSTEPRLEFRSDSWNAVYEARVAKLAAIVSERGLPLLWVGQVPYGSRRMTSDMVAFNDIYRRVSESANGIFVDVWDGFVDESGAYITSGPDMNGQPARLRASDGINITRAGRRKIAFFAEKPLRRLLGEAASPEISRLEPGVQLESLPSGPVRIDRTPPIALGDLNMEESTELLGATFELPEREVKEGEPGLIANGLPAEAPEGRADRFERQ